LWYQEFLIIDVVYKIIEKNIGKKAEKMRGPEETV
jgi:hypothetical protein